MIYGKAHLPGLRGRCLLGRSQKRLDLSALWSESAEGKRGASKMSIYEVTCADSQLGKFDAKTGEQAKHKACKYWGRVTSCPWTGIRGMKAKKVR